MSFRPCAICGPKRASRALCNCCELYLCRDHLKEHDDLLNAQVEPLVDEINQLAEQLEHFRVDRLCQTNRQELDRWRQLAVQSIDRMHEEKCQELTRTVDRRLSRLREQAKEIQRHVAALAREQDATTEQIHWLRTSIDTVQRATNELEKKPAEVELRPLQLDEHCISISPERKSDDAEQLTLTSPIQSLRSSVKNADCLAHNARFILLHRYPTLALFDRNLNVLNETNPVPNWSIADACWSHTLSRFLILTNEHLYILDETTMELQQCPTTSRIQGHWHSITCSHQRLFLTAYKWGTHVHQYKINASTIEFHRPLPTPVICSNDESIDHFLHDNVDRLAMIRQSRATNSKSFDVRSDSSFECLWSLDLHQCQMTIHRHRFCAVERNRWLIVDTNQAQLFLISAHGSVEQTLAYPSPSPRRALQIEPSLLLVSTDATVNLHQLL